MMYIDVQCKYIDKYIYANYLIHEMIKKKALKIVNIMRENIR